MPFVSHTTWTAGKKLKTVTGSDVSNNGDLSLSSSCPSCPHFGDVPGHTFVVMLGLVGQAVQIILQGGLEIFVSLLNEGYRLKGTASAVLITIV